MELLNCCYSDYMEENVVDDWNKLSDRENFARIISAYADTVFRVSYQYVCNRQDAEDIVQEVFLSLVERMRLCPFSDDEHLKAWLIRVAINKSINAAKRGARRRTVDTDNLPLSRRGEETQLDEELARLSADDRQVIYLHYYEGYSAKEIAQFMQINENAVHKRLSRARAKLKKFLEED